MKLKRIGRGLLAVLMSATFCLLTACSKDVISGETAFVAPEKVKLRNSTAEAARVVGEIRSGDQVVVVERSTEGNTQWAHVNAPSGQAGWLEARYLVKGEIVEEARKLAEEIKAVPAQATGKSKARLKLRLTPDRSGEDNVALELPAGTTMEVVARERKPRPESKTVVPAQANPQAAAAPAGPKYDEWYKVRLKDYAILPAGWIYGGSVELEIPGEIQYFASTGRRIVGWQKLGSAADAQGKSGDHYLVAEKLLFDADENVDFDRIKVLAFDPHKRDYSTPFRAELPGRFPLIVKLEGSQGQLQVTALDKVTGQPQPVEYAVELAANGKVKVTRVTPTQAAPGGK